MWRVRNIIQILIFFFLWDSVFRDHHQIIFGYSKEKILTYAFLLLFVRAFVMSSRSNDAAGQIANGDLSNLLLKPLNFFKYWLTRDLASKFLNLIFSSFEIAILFFLLRPDIFIQFNLLNWLYFVLATLIAIFIFFNILMLTNFVPFWAPETAWGAQFLIIVIITEFLSGAFFPLDVFPEVVFDILKFTPFPYLIYVPIKIYLGADISFIIQSFAISVFWSIALWKITNLVYQKGLKVYEGVGR